jgi:hypothetical protein
MRVTVSGGKTFVTNPGGAITTARDLSGLPGYPGSVTDASVTVMGNHLIIDVVNPSNSAAELTCTVNGGTSLQAGSSLASACGSWAAIPFP